MEGARRKQGRKARNRIETGTSQWSNGARRASDTLRYLRRQNDGSKQTSLTVRYD